MTPSARLTPDLIRALYAEAASLEFGLRIPIEAVYQDYAKSIITKTMPGNDQIMLCAFPLDDELWLVRKTVEVIL